MSRPRVKVQALAIVECHVAETGELAVQGYRSIDYCCLKAAPAAGALVRPGLP